MTAAVRERTTGGPKTELRDLHAVTERNGDLTYTVRSTDKEPQILLSFTVAKGSATPRVFREDMTGRFLVEPAARNPWDMPKPFKTPHVEIKTISASHRAEVEVGAKNITVDKASAASSAKLSVHSANHAEASDNGTVKVKTDAGSAEADRAGQIFVGGDLNTGLVLHRGEITVQGHTKEGFIRHGGRFATKTAGDVTIDWRTGMGDYTGSFAILNVQETIALLNIHGDPINELKNTVNVTAKNITKLVASRARGVIRGKIEEEKLTHCGYLKINPL